MSLNIDKEWENFISSSYDGDDISDYDPEDNINNFVEEIASANLSMEINSETPKASAIYISTKTKIAYLNMPIELKNVFWFIPVIPYARPCNGVIKKQMKFNSTTVEELDFIQSKLTTETYFEEHIITNINNPTGRIKFKDIRNSVQHADQSSFASQDLVNLVNMTEGLIFGEGKIIDILCNTKR